MQDGAAAQRPFDMSWLAEFVDDLSEFDRAMNKAVTDSGILRHVPRRALAKEGTAPPPRLAACCAVPAQQAADGCLAGSIAAPGHQELWGRAKHTC